jgi:hypothetical protein
MQPVTKTASFARAALLGGFVLALGVPACSEDSPSLGTCETATAGSSGSGGSGGGGSGSASVAGDSSDAGEPPIGGMSTGGGGGTGGAAGKGGTGGKGGSGGAAAGTGGSGGVAGTGGSSGTGGGSGGGTTLQICQACEEKCNKWNGDPVVGTDGCLNMPGVAQAGPAKSVELSVLCAELLDCMLRTSCPTLTTDGETACYCTNAFTCQMTGGNGLCVDEIEAAAESDDYAIIGMRLGDPSYAVGRAVLASTCYREECPGVCYH